MGVAGRTGGRQAPAGAGTTAVCAAGCTGPSRQVLGTQCSWSSLLMAPVAAARCAAHHTNSLVWVHAAAGMGLRRPGGWARCLTSTQTGCRRRLLPTTASTLQRSHFLRCDLRCRHQLHAPVPVADDQWLPDMQVTQFASADADAGGVRHSAGQVRQIL